jgi:hypothetical protein
LKSKSGYRYVGLGVDGKPHTKVLGVRDRCANKNFTLKESPLKSADLDDFLAWSCAGRRDKRHESNASDPSRELGPPQAG